MKTIHTSSLILPEVLNEKSVIEWCLNLCRNEITFHWEEDIYDCLDGVLPKEQLDIYEKSLDTIWSFGKEEGSLFDTLFLTCIAFDHLGGLYTKVGYEDIIKYNNECLDGN